MFRQFICKRYISNIINDSYGISSIYNSRKDSLAFDSLSATDHGLNIIKNSEINNVKILDYDIFANKTDELEENSAEFVETVIRKFNKVQEAVRVLDSANHSLVRYFISVNQEDKILNLLKDKIQTSIFLDAISCNLLVKNLINKGKIDDAIFVFYQMYLQSYFESDVTSPTLNCLLLHTMREFLQKKLYIKEPSSENEPEKKTEQVSYVRVPYLRNPNYDDYLDVTESRIMAGKLFRSKSELFDRNLVDLISFILEEKFHLALKLDFASIKLSEESITLIKDIVSATETTEEVVEKRGIRRLATTAEKDQLLDHLSGLKKGDLDLIKSIDDVIEDILKDPKFQTIEEEITNKIYTEFNAQRESLYLNRMKESDKMEKLSQAMNILEEILETEEYVTYFDNKDKIEYNSWLAPRSREERKLSKLKVYRSNIRKYQSSKEGVSS